MSNHNYSSIRQRCDDLTKTGDILSVSWDGGNDSGMFEIKLNDMAVEVTSEADDSIIALVADYLGYGSFAGDFSTEGQVIYNRKSRCFEGTDRYGETEDDIKACSIPVVVSREIWFDEFHIHVEIDAGISEIEAQIIVLDGPYTDAHGSYETEVSNALQRSFSEAIETVANFDRLWDEFIIKKSEFAEDGDNWVYMIREFSYAAYKTDEKDIIIRLHSNI